MGQSLRPAFHYFVRTRFVAAALFLERRARRQQTDSQDRRKRDRECTHDLPPVALITRGPRVPITSRQCSPASRIRKARKGGVPFFHNGGQSMKTALFGISMWL